MQFEIQLTFPRRQFIPVFVLSLRQKIIGSAEADLRYAFERFHAQTAFNMSLRRSASAVTDSKDGEKSIHEAVLQQAVLSMTKLFRQEVGVVGVFRRKMGEHFGPVDSLPQKGVMGEFVELTPGDLLCDEVVAARFPDDLGHRGGVTEHIGEPQVLHFNTKFVSEKIFTVNELTYHRFSGNQIAIGLDPHAALKLPETGRDLLPDLFIQLRIVFPGGLIIMRLRRAEHIAGVVFNIINLAGESPRAFPDRLLHPPVPGDVDMGVTDRRNVHRRGQGRKFQNAFQYLATGNGVRRIVVKHKIGITDGLQNARGTIVIVR
ncbi:hypothetical protein SDC9_129049 [bioreactor metagenome]|uniref:Uncharacterized protein n=1 Tax=bioreactor metagenome TaxID=1076179 RepID=A0A645CYM6_9ZZZZ